MLRRMFHYSDNYQNIYILLLSFCIKSLHINASGGCRNLDFLGCIKNKAFVNHTIHTSNVLSPGLEQCQHECFMNGACVSYNLGPTRGMMRICELSNTDHVGYPDHVVVKEGFEYCPIKSPCSSKPCPASLRCIPDFSWDSFFCTCDMDISKPLGIEDGRIPDSALTASSSWRQNHGPHLGRLNLDISNSVSCWSSRIKRAGEYLQVSLDEEFVVNGVATQGRSTMRQWVESYSVSYSMDGTDWIEYREDGTSTPKIFQGNSDQNTVVKHSLVPFNAKFVRVVVQTWYSHISMRIEVYGCKFH